MHHLSSIGGVAVLGALEDGQSRTSAVETLDARHDVDHGFGVEARYRCAPDVFNRAGHEPCADRIDKKLPFGLKSARPIPIVRNDVYGRLVGHNLRVDAGRTSPIDVAEIDWEIQSNVLHARRGAQSAECLAVPLEKCTASLIDIEVLSRDTQHAHRV